MAFSKISGVYAINCLATKKVYVGSAISVKQRLASHRSMLKNKAHTNKHLQRAYDKYGSDSFVMEMLESCESDKRIEREQAWIDYYDASNPEFGMNNSPIATTTEGFRHSEATKARLSEIAKARDHSKLRAITAAMRGIPAHNKGVPGIKWTEERKAQASAKKKGQKAWNKGLQHTEETKKKISIGSSIALTRYGSDIAESIIAMRKSGQTWQSISNATGVSLSQCSKIGRGMRTFEKTKGVASKYLWHSSSPLLCGTREVRRLPSAQNAEIYGAVRPDIEHAVAVIDPHLSEHGRLASGKLGWLHVVPLAPAQDANQ